MFNTDKCSVIPKSLAKEKAKEQKINKSGSYRDNDVLKQLKIDFFEKCYLCEIKLFDNEMKVEHFYPHLGNIDRMFDWGNLFLSCDQCNGIKGDEYNNLRKNKKEILNCTNWEHDVYDWLCYRYLSDDLVSFNVDIEVKENIIKENSTTLQMAINTSELLKKFIIRIK